ncbi:MAG: hypothetical protein ACJAXX_002493 [Roseivirga sp.]|jgi:hypothetical protein
MLYTIIFFCFITAVLDAQNSALFAEEDKEFKKTVDQSPKKKRIVFRGSSSVRL